MKKYFIPGLFFLLPALPSTAQTTDRYCEVITTQRWNSPTNLKVTLVKGSVDSLSAFKDSAAATAIDKVTQLRSDPDVLNFMAAHGWSFVSALSPAPGIGLLYFRKNFSPENPAPSR